ncbi:MAG: PASTA domain-containing protein [Gemmatimonadaceae bacterium]
MRWRGLVRRSLPYLISATAGFVLAYAIIASFVFPRRLTSSDVRVPNVVGLSTDDASQQLTEKGLVPGVGEQRYHASAPVGTVLEQDPAAEETEVRGATVRLHVSRGQRQGEVPPLVGLTREQAELAIENAGLDVGQVIERASASPRGQVVASRPVARARVPVPSPVELTVSTGPATVQVPDVVGLSYSQSRALVAQLGLALGAVTFDSLSLTPPGTVIGQSPAANSSAPAGSSVSLTVAGRRP